MVGAAGGRRRRGGAAARGLRARRRAAVGQGERDVYLSVGADVWRAAFDQLTADGAPSSCGVAERVASLDSSPTGAVAVDANGNCTSATPRACSCSTRAASRSCDNPSPPPASGVAFGGGGYGTLYASGGDGVWAVAANIAAAPRRPADALLKQLEKLDNAGVPAYGVVELRDMARFTAFSLRSEAVVDDHCAGTWSAERR